MPTFKDIEVKEEMVQESIARIQEKIKFFQEPRVNSEDTLTRRPMIAQQILHEAAILIEVVSTMRGQRIDY